MTAIRTLLVSTLFPSATQPRHGIFVETRLRQLLLTGQIETRVVAPVPWFPLRSNVFGRYAEFASIADRELRHGVKVLHPRFLLMPKIGMSMAPFGLALALRSAVKQLSREGYDFDLIDAQYFYPDGVAAAILANWTGKPLVITARGSDINVIAKHRLPRAMIRWAATRASACVGVSKALSDAMADLGIAPAKLVVWRNGVDLTSFKPVNTSIARQHLGVSGEPVLLCVGNLVPIKGHALALEALAQLRGCLPGVRLYIVGSGGERKRLEERARDLGVEAATRFVGAVPQEQLPYWYSAADILLHPSSLEGWPNVLLEAMACGTPVLASDVGGIPEIVNSAAAGQLLQQRDGESIATAIQSMYRKDWNRAATRAHAALFDWSAVSQAQLRAFSAIIGR